MATADWSEPIADDELLFRRIPASEGWYDPDANPPLSPDAFRPNQMDKTGLSVSRAKFKSVSAAGLGRAGKSYYVATLLAGSLRQHGIEVIPKPELPDDPGHAEIPSMTYENRKSLACREAKIALATQLSISIEGPFTTPADN